MSDSLRPHGPQPTRLLCPWDFSGKSTGVGCHCLLWYGVISSVQFSSVAQSCPSLCNPMDCSLPGSSVHGSFQARVLEWVASAFSKRTPDEAVIKCPPPPQLLFFFFNQLSPIWASLVAQTVKNPPAVRETWVQSLDWEDSLDKGTARIPWTA